MGRTLFALAAAFCGTVFLHASSVVCTQATGASNVFTDQSCSPLFTPISLLDWGSNGGGSGPVAHAIPSVELLLLTGSNGVFSDQLDVAPALEPAAFLYGASCLFILWILRNRWARATRSRYE